MPKTTPYLGLPMKDPTTDGNDYFNVETMINDPLEMIDQYAQNTDQELTTQNNTISNHLSAETPHEFQDETQKKYAYGFKQQGNRLVFVFQEVV